MGSEMCIRDSARRGTAKKVSTLKRLDLAGKTGTTNEAESTWFTGFNDYLVTSVWVGFDQPKSLGSREFGSSTALPIWIDYIESNLKDLPRNRILRDESLVEIAHHAPKTSDELSQTRGFTQKKAKGSTGKSLLNAIQIGLSVPEEKLPEIKREKPLPRGIGPVTDLLKVMLKMKCEEYNVAQKLIATGGDLGDIAAFGVKANVPALQGWRFQIFGEDALSLRAGHLALTINGRNLELVEFED